MAFMSFAAYARHRGVSKPAVTRAVREGRVTPVIGPDGKQGLESEEADAQWNANSRPRSDFQSPYADVDSVQPLVDEAELSPASEIDEVIASVASRVEQVAQSVAPSRPRPQVFRGEEQPRGDKTYNDARVEKEEIQAKLLQLKFDELSGDLVSAKDVENLWASIATKIKTKVLGIAPKLKQRHAEMTVEQFITLDLICREALEELADGDY